MSFEQLVAEIKQLPMELRVQLVDRIIEDFDDGVDPEIEKAHLEIIAERQRNPGNFVAGAEVIQRAHDLLNELQVSRRS